jgi:hypothetical protein
MTEPDHNPVEFLVVGRVVEPGCSAQNIDGALVATQEAVLPEVGDLLAGVAGNTVREGDLQRPPNLVVLTPRSEFLGDETGIGVEEGSGEVGPEGLARKVGDVNVVPRRLADLAVERSERS